MSDKWPRSFYTNGHLSIDGQKMSKSKGNFFTLSEAINEFSADATRFALADSGDGLDDANFNKQTANAAILKLTKEAHWIHETMINLDSLRTGGYTFADHVFTDEMNHAIIATSMAFEKLKYRDALKSAFHDLHIQRDQYRNRSHDQHINVLQRYFEVSIKLLSPICPHLCQHLWHLTLQDKEFEFVFESTWPRAEPVDLILGRQSRFLHQLNTSVKKSYTDMLQKYRKLALRTASDIGHTLNQSDSIVSHEPFDSCVIFITNEYLEWQLEIINTLCASSGESKSLSVLRTNFFDHLKHNVEMCKLKREQWTKFANSLLNDMEENHLLIPELSLPYDQASLMEQQKELVMKDVPVKSFQVQSVNDHNFHNDYPGIEAIIKKCIPGKPQPYFYKRK